MDMSFWQNIRRWLHCQNDNFRCNKLKEFCQNDKISFSMYRMHNKDESRTLVWIFIYKRHPLILPSHTRNMVHWGQTTKRYRQVTFVGTDQDREFTVFYRYKLWQYQIALNLFAPCAAPRHVGATFVDRQSVWRWSTSFCRRIYHGRCQKSH